MMYIMYCKSSCPYCYQAEELFKSNNVSFTKIDLEGHEEVWSQVKQSYNWDTVPMILNKDGKLTVLVGGFSDLKRYLVPNE